MHNRILLRLDLSLDKKEVVGRVFAMTTSILIFGVDPFSSISNYETFLQDFLIVLKRFRITRKS